MDLVAQPGSSDDATAAGATPPGLAAGVAYAGPVLLLHCVLPDAAAVAACAAMALDPDMGAGAMDATLATAAVAMARPVRAAVGATAGTVPPSQPRTATAAAVTAAACPPLPVPPSVRRLVIDTLAVGTAARVHGPAYVASAVRLTAVTLLTLPVIGLVAAKGDSPAPFDSRATSPAGAGATALSSAPMLARGGRFSYGGSGGSSQLGADGRATPNENALLVAARRWSLVALPSMWSHSADPASAVSPGTSGPHATSGVTPTLAPAPVRARVHSVHLFFVVMSGDEIVYNSLLAEPGVCVLPSTTPAVTLPIKGPPLQLQGAFAVRVYHRRTSHAPIRIVSADFHTGQASGADRAAPCALRMLTAWRRHQLARRHGPVRDATQRS